MKFLYMTSEITHHPSAANATQCLKLNNMRNNEPSFWHYPSPDNMWTLGRFLYVFGYENEATNVADRFDTWTDTWSTTFEWDPNFDSNSAMVGRWVGSVAETYDRVEWRRGLF